MNLTIPQRGVMRGMAAALAVTIVAFGVAALVQPFGDLPAKPASRLQCGVLAGLAPTLALAICIARLAAHRFWTPEDLDGGGLTAGTGTAKLLQALLQNTLEQAVLALPVYVAWSVAGPARLLGLALAASLLFFCGRLMFFRGYQRGAPGRAFGFALTFYPTVLLLAGTIIHAVLMVTGMAA